MGGGGGGVDKCESCCYLVHNRDYINLWKTTRVFCSEFQYCEPLLSRLNPG